jgi:hypothetical protein
MRTNLNREMISFDDVTDGDLVGYWHPRDIVDDPRLAHGRKRELLAHWASDIHAVAGAPALRALAGGVTATIDDILDALKQLDGLYDPPQAMGSYGAEVIA